MSQLPTHLYYRPNGEDNNDAGTVMKYSGHKTLESFSGYLHPTEQGSILAIQAMKDVALILRSFENAGDIQNVENKADVSANLLPSKQLAV